MKKSIITCAAACAAFMSAFSAEELFPNGDMAKLDASGWPVGWTSNAGQWWADVVKVITPGGGQPNTLRLVGENAQIPFEIPLKMEYDTLRLKARMGATDVAKGGEDWQNARIMVTFHDDFGDQVGGWPQLIEMSGTVAMGDRQQDYKVPAGARMVKLSPANLGKSGTVDVQNISLTVAATRVVSAAELAAAQSGGSKLVSASILDREHIMLFFKDGEVVFSERALPNEPLYETHQSASQHINKLEKFGLLRTSQVPLVDGWKITSANDASFGAQGVSPSAVHRKSKLGGMAQMGWAGNDFHYDWAYDHTLFLKLPKPLTEGKTYVLKIPASVNSDTAETTLVFDIFNNRSESVRVNTWGYSTAPSIKAADVYMWMGDGGARDYASFAGSKVFIYNTKTKEKKQVGALSFWKAEAAEVRQNHQMLRAPVWNADFTGFNTPGTYRIAVEGIGCSEDFTIAGDIWREPYKTAVRGFFYMRIGEDNLKIVPVPRRPLFIPGKSPENCVVYVTTLHPFNEDWKKLSGGGDGWDNTTMWKEFVKPGSPTNPNAYGGHSDALDWDRHLGHVSIIYDMLLPYIITGGALSEDNLQITESGNGIPDIIDEARNEVDFFLRLRDPQTGGYSHGLNNPDRNNVLYQAGGTTLSAWANAANAAMLAESFRVAKKPALMETYAKAAAEAYAYALRQPDPMHDAKQDVGEMTMTGKNFRTTAAAYLYNVTGETRYEDDLAKFTQCDSPASVVCEHEGRSELYSYAAYLFTNRKVNHPKLQANMRASIIAEAKAKEAGFANIRPSRRTTDDFTGWYQGIIKTQRSIIAHAVSDKGSADRKLFEDALILEADYSLGRNPMNMIHMTTAATALEGKRSTENAYTSGWNDGTPGVHPGHTPYMGIWDWGGQIMGNPTWMSNKNYPAAAQWPLGEMYFNTRYVYAANEFTPQQTMRGKMALYAYLRALEAQ